MFLVASFLDIPGMQEKVTAAQQALVASGRRQVSASEHARIRTWEYR